MGVLRMEMKKRVRKKVNKRIAKLPNSALETHFPGTKKEKEVTNQQLL